VLLNESIPGGSKNPYSKGGTLTHKVGHWLGLYHTFEGGCIGNGNGDGMDNTPAETLNYDCTKDRDTCPLQDTFDPVNNSIVCHFSSLFFFAKPFFFENVSTVTVLLLSVVILKRVMWKVTEWMN
jgi:hypothetical protein